MWKYALLLLFFALPLYTKAVECPILEDLSFQQRNVVYNTFYEGMKHDLQYTLSAIVIRESSAGSYPINARGTSYGAFHINVKYAVKRVPDVLGLNWEPNPFNENRLALLLIKDYNTSLLFAIDNIRYWQMRRGANNWNDIWASYYAGGYYKEDYAVQYAREIANNIAELKKCQLEVYSPLLKQQVANVLVY